MNIIEKKLKAFKEELNELETELYVPKGKNGLNISLTTTFINGNRIKEIPPVWRDVIKNIILAINKKGLTKLFANQDTKNIDIIGASPVGLIKIQDDNGKKYIYNTKTKEIT